MPKLCKICKCDEVWSNQAIYCQTCKISALKFSQLKHNSSSGYARHEEVEIVISKQDFCVWRKKQRQVCYYCRIPEELLQEAGFKSQIQEPLLWIGVDRKDSELGYEEDNLVPCCFVCNQIKGNRFNEIEMQYIGRAIKAVWKSRVG